MVDGRNGTPGATVEADPMDTIGWSVLYVSLLGALLLSQIGVWAVLYQVVKQQGRLLLRLDELERGQDHAGFAGHGAQLPVLSQAATAAASIGPKIGDSVAAFRLPDLTGHEVGLEDFHGKRVLLVHWSPTCGFCDLIAPDLADQHAPLLARGIHLVLVSYGDPVANLQLAQKYGLNCPILVQPDHAQLNVFRNQGTPVACLVDEQGRVARQLAVGADAVPRLVRDLLDESETASDGVPSEDRRKGRRLPGQRPLSESRIVRDGLKAGTPAPTFTLPDIYGRGVSLESYRGRPAVLVFSDPHCGPCDLLAPHLARVSRACRESGLELIMISRGDVEESRRKAEQHGLDFPILVQQRWEISTAYGIFATPVAFAVGENGVIQQDVAQGGEAILALIQDQLEVGKELRGGLAIR
jgi:peroxiredoxin